MNKDELYHSLQMEFNKINKADELQQPLIINKEQNLFKSTIVNRNYSSNVIKRYSPLIDISDYLKKDKVHSCSNTVVISDSKNNHSNETDEEITTDISKNLHEMFNDINKNNTIQKLIINKDINELEHTIKLFDENKELQKEMISRKDIRGNTPVMLCTILHSIKKEQIFIEILSLLLKNNADFKKKNIFEKSPLDVAGANTDKEIVELLYESYCKRQKEKMDRNCREVSLYFSTMKDFYVEMNWEVHIPILSFLCPKDTCKVWKKGSNLRMDTTFVTFKNLSSVRGNLSFMLMNNNDRINTFKFNRDKKIYFDMFEPLDSEEKKLIIKEILDKKRVNGSFKILKCQLHESLSYFGKKKIYETVNGWPTQKFKIELTVSMDIFPNEKIVFDDINEDNYLNSNINIIKERTIVGDHKEFKKKLLEGGGLNNDKLIHSEKEKQLKAYVWIVDKSPIKSKDMVNLINSIASVNEVTQKLKDFLNHPDVVEIINNNGFPIKIQIPYNIFINFTIHFNNYKEYSDPNDKDISDKFDIINQCQRVARKIEQNVMKDEKMRLKYANIR